MEVWLERWPYGCACSPEKEPHMLVLARQRDESIVIGDEIIVTVVDIRGDKVRLGINAPRSVSVHRKEIWEAIRKENESAAKLTQADVAVHEGSDRRGACRPGRGRFADRVGARA
jgi:carbon storage regulator